MVSNFSIVYIVLDVACYVDTFSPIEQNVVTSRSHASHVEI